MEKKDSNAYSQILEMFVVSEIDDFRLKYQRPFIYEGKVCATDAYSVVAFDKNKLSTLGFRQSEKEEMANIYPKERLFEHRIKFNQFQELLKLVPEIPEEYEEVTITKCSDCDGYGVVEYVYTANSGEEYSEDFECPVCGGEGEIEESKNAPTGRMIKDPDAICRIKNCLFLSRQLNRLFDVMKLLGGEDLILLNQTEKHKPNLFSVGDVEVLVMPCRSDDEEPKIVFSID